MMEEILVCENLTMTFNDGEYIVHALKNVSFSLHKNEVLGIIGSLDCISRREEIYFLTADRLSA